LTGALTIGGSVSLASNASINFDINGSNYDPLNISGILAVAGTANLTFNALSLTASSYTLATFSPNSPALSPNDFNFTALAGYTLSVGGSNLMLVANPPPPTWQGASSTSWTNTGNWSGGTVPNGTGIAAIVGSATASPTTITLDGPQTLGRLTLSATSSATGYSLTAGNGGSLTMDNDNGTSQILISGGSHGISAAVILAEPLAITASAGTTLNIAGNISEQAPGAGSLLLAGPGMLILGGSDTYTGSTRVTAGTLIVTSSTSLAAGMNLTVAGGATFLFDPSVAAAPAAGGGASLADSPGGVAAAVPEPGTLALLGVAAIVAAAAWRRRKGG
jgi:autotransporter-associated beta strand protein